MQAACSNPECGQYPFNDLTTSQRALIAAGFLAYEQAEARKRQIELGKTNGKTLPANLPEGYSTGEARDKAGERMHVGGRTVDDAAKVLARAVPEIIEKVRRGDMAINEAKTIAGFNPAAQKRISGMDGRKGLSQGVANLPPL